MFGKLKYTFGHFLNIIKNFRWNYYTINFLIDKLIAFISINFIIMTLIGFFSFNIANAFPYQNMTLLMFICYAFVIMWFNYKFVENFIEDFSDFINLGNDDLYHFFDIGLGVLLKYYVLYGISSKISNFYGNNRLEFREDVEVGEYFRLRYSYDNENFLAKISLKKLEFNPEKGFPIKSIIKLKQLITKEILIRHAGAGEILKALD